MITVYIAGPLTKPQPGINCKIAMRVANELMYKGFFFYIPHMMHYMDQKFPHHYEEWMTHDIHWLKKCDCLLRIPGESPGADREVAIATSIGMPVFYHVQDIVDWRLGLQYPELKK